MLVYLVSEGFAERVCSIDQPPPNISIALNDRGRKLKQQGSIRAYDRWNHREELEESFRRSMAESTYWVTVSIALSTGVAAVYYYLQIRDGSAARHVKGAHITAVLCISSIVLLLLRRYLPRLFRKKTQK